MKNNFFLIFIFTTFLSSCGQKENINQTKKLLDICYSKIEFESKYSTNKALAELRNSNIETQQSQEITAKIELINLQASQILEEIACIKKVRFISASEESRIRKLKRDLVMYIFRISLKSKYLIPQYLKNNDFQYVVSEFCDFELYSSPTLTLNDEINLTKFEIITVLMCDNVCECLFQEISI